MIRNQEHIEKLLARFFEGRTDNEQEKELAEFFGSDEVPERWQGYRAMFGYLETGLAGDLAGVAPVPAVKPASKPRGHVRERRMWYAGIAASLLTVVVCLSILIGKGPQRHELGEFEGSYIVRNGKVITDAGEVMPEIDATLREIGRLQQEMQQAEEEACELERQASADDLDWVRNVEIDLSGVNS